MHRKNTKLNLLATAIIFRVDNTLDCLQNREKVRNDLKSQRNIIFNKLQHCCFLTSNVEKNGSENVLSIPKTKQKRSQQPNRSIAQYVTVLVGKTFDLAVHVTKRQKEVT